MATFAPPLFTRQVESLRVGDIGDHIYVNVLKDNGEPYNVDLKGFSSRTLRLRRPNTFDVVTIADVPVVDDPLDGIQKLRVMSGLESDLTLSGSGNFILSAAHVGVWIGEVEFQLSGWIGKSPQFIVFELQHKLL